MDTLIINLLKHKFYLFIVSILLFSSYMSYEAGKKKGYVSREVLCKDDIFYLDQCMNDLETSNKQCSELLIQCKTNCKIDTCKSACIDQAREAVENYKKLQNHFECND